MSRCICFCLLFGLIFAIINCVKQTGNLPFPVVFVGGVADTCRVEEGIDAVPESDAIRLEWIPNSTDYIEYYGLYRSIDRSQGYNLISEVAAGSDSYIDDDVLLHRRYYYYIVAVSDDGLWSEASDTLSYQLIHKPVGLDPNGVTSEGTPNFSWRDPNNAAAYVVRLKDEASGDYIWIREVPSSYSGDRESVLFNDDGRATIQTLLPSTDYRWRVDVIGPEEASGSESQWIGIRVQ